MSLSSASTLKDQILSLKPSTDKMAATVAFVDVLGDFLDQIQAGSLGTPGILTFNRPVMVSGLMALTPVNNDSWMAGFANAWQAGMLASVIAPATVTNAAWIGSGNKDTLTLPSAAATILTIPLATTTLLSSLSSVSSNNNPPLPLAEAVRNASLALVFTVIGLGAPPALPPIPIPIPAQ